MRPSIRLCLPPVCVASSGDLASPGVGGSIVSSRSSNVAPEGVVCGPTGSLMAEPLQLPWVWNLLVQPHVRRYRHGLETLQLHAWSLSSVLSERQAFREKLRVSQQQTSGAPQLSFTSRIRPGSLVGVIDGGVSPCKATIPEIAEFFLFLCQELGLFVSAVKGFRAALNHVFLPTGLDLAASLVVSRMFRHFERSCPPLEIRPLDWNFSLVLRCLSRPPFEPLKLALDKHLTWKTSFLLVLASAKKV